ncbi:unnamed protein product [Urochloa humidicola]
MGLLALHHLLSLQCDRRQRHQRRNRHLNGSIAAAGKRKSLPCQQDGHGDSKSAKRMRCSIPELPEILGRSDYYFANLSREDCYTSRLAASLEPNPPDLKQSCSACS